MSTEPAFRAQREIEIHVLLAALKTRDREHERPYEATAAERMIKRLESVIAKAMAQTPLMFQAKPVKAPKRVPCACGESFVGDCAPCDALDAQAKRLAR